MPFLVPLVPVITAITAAASATVGGLEAAGTFSPSMGSEMKQQQVLSNEAAQKADQVREQEAFKSFAPGAQAQTGGALSDTSLSSMIAELAGSPADTNLAQQTLFGNAQGLSSGG